MRPIGLYYIEVLCRDGVWRRERRWGFIRNLVDATLLVDSYTDYGRVRRVDKGLARNDSVVWYGKKIEA